MIVGTATKVEKRSLGLAMAAVSRLSCPTSPFTQDGGRVDLGACDRAKESIETDLVRWMRL